MELRHVEGMRMEPEQATLEHSAQISGQSEDEGDNQLNLAECVSPSLGRDPGGRPLGSFLNPTAHRGYKLYRAIVGPLWGEILEGDLWGPLRVVNHLVNQ